MFQLPVDYNTLSWQQRKAVREQYIEEQGMACFYCDGDLMYAPSEMGRRLVDRSLFPQYFFDYPIHLQHDHDTGMTEGAVHAHCNAVMWQYEGR